MRRVVTLPQLAADCEAVARRANDLAPVLRTFEILAVSGVKKRFSDGTDPTGRKWLPIRFRPSGGNRPLLDTGMLRASINGRHDTRSITVGTNAVQARLQNYGGVIRP